MTDIAYTKSQISLFSFISVICSIDFTRILNFFRTTTRWKGKHYNIKYQIKTFPIQHIKWWQCHVRYLWLHFNIILTGKMKWNLLCQCYSPWNHIDISINRKWKYTFVLIGVSFLLHFWFSRIIPLQTELVFPHYWNTKYYNEIV